MATRRNFLEDLTCFSFSFHPRLTQNTPNMFIIGVVTRLYLNTLFVIILIPFSNHWSKDGEMKYSIKLIKSWKYEKIRPKRQILKSSIENFFPEIQPKIEFKTFVISNRSIKMVQLEWRFSIKADIKSNLKLIFFELSYLITNNKFELTQLFKINLKFYIRFKYLILHEKTNSSSNSYFFWMS